jgi:Ca-activated chloride channel homolog
MTEQKQSKLARNIRRAVLAGLGLAMVAAIIVFVATREAKPVKAAPIQARLELAAGDVSIDSGKGLERAVSGAALLADTKLETAKGARALVRLPDGSRIFLRAESSVTLGADSLTLERGQYWLDAPPTDRKPLVHEVAGASVSAADAGLDVKRDGSSVAVYVARGMATLSGKGGRVEIKAGEQAKLEGDAAPAVSAVAFWDDWTGGMADFAPGSGIPGAGTGTIYGVDVGALPGSAARKLELSQQAVRVELREGLSQTEVDQTFFNPGERAVEGWYWFSVPERASVTGFAVETDGVLVEGEFIERKEAAAQYEAAKSSGHSPAILEWVDARTYRARIYPVTAGGNRRVVLRYVELHGSPDGKLSYVYPMGQGDAVRIGEFSLAVNLGSPGKRMKIATLADARIEAGGERVTMRRSGYTPRADFQLEATLPKQRPPLTLARHSAGGEKADYVLARYAPDVDWSKIKQQRGDVVVVVDTSAAGDEAARQLKAQTAEAILRALSDEDRFALVALDVRPSVLHPKADMAPAADQEIDKALEALSDHAAGGATDLASVFDVALGRLHGAEQPAIVYVGDGIATSGEMMGEQIVERLRRALTTSRARLFTVAIGTDADHSLLSELSRAGGGVPFRIDEADQTTARALELTAVIKTPTMTDVEIDLGAGLDEPFYSASSKIARGQELMVLARTHHDIPRRVKVRGRLGGEAFEKEYEVEPEKSALASFVPRLWAAEHVRRLLGGAQGPDAERGRIVALGIEYGLMTPFTSVLALESEAAYSRMGIPRRKGGLRGDKLGAVDFKEEQRRAGRHFAAPAAVMPGCSKLESLGEESSPASSPFSEKKGNVSEIGDMGSQRTPSARGQYAAKGAADTERSEDQPPPPALSPPAEPLAAEPPAYDKEAKSDDDYRPKPKAAMRAPRHSLGGGGPAGPSPVYAAKPPPEGRNRLDLPHGGRQETTTVAFERKVALETCSDTSARPLAQRVLVWRKRIKTANNPQALVERYDSAVSACELTDWRAERTFLELLQRRVDSEGAATIVLAHFAGRPDVQKHLAKLILRRAVDTRLVAAVERALFGSAVDWAKVDRELSEIADIEARIERLRVQIAKAPDDPNGGMRLVRLQVEAGKKEDALALGRRLRDQGLLTPQIARQLGDVLARSGNADEAVRTYSEIVEFDPESIDSRRLLGDIYLGHGWYEPAYRQYRSITELAESDPLGWLRLAAAAAGAGRIDEALRLERRVASAQGTPGPNDPRRWARLMSAARLARLIAAPPKSGAKPESVKRELKELGLFSGPGRLVLVTWEDLSIDALVTTSSGGEDRGLGDLTDAAKVGLSAVLLTSADAERAELVARLRSVPQDHAVALLRQDIVWNGKDFSVTLAKKEIAPKATDVRL